MREIVHLQTGQCGNQIGAKVRKNIIYLAWQIIPQRLIQLHNVTDVRSWCNAAREPARHSCELILFFVCKTQGRNVIFTGVNSLFFLSVSHTYNILNIKNNFKNVKVRFKMHVSHWNGVEIGHLASLCLNGPRVSCICLNFKVRNFYGGSNFSDNLFKCHW